MRRMVALWLTIVVSDSRRPAGRPSAGGGLFSGLLGGGCGVTAPVFLPWGDYSGYYFAPNGGFESGAASWSLSGGAAVVTQDNEPWYLAGFGSHALSDPDRAAAPRPPVCLRSHLSRRAVLRGRLRRRRQRSTFALCRAVSSASFRSSTAARSRPARTWRPSPKLSTLFSALGAPLGSKTMTLQFTVERGTAQIDDLFVDPFLMKG